MKNELFVLDNQIQNYAWGSHTAIADLMGHTSPSEQPQAELWMGAHPKAPSRLNVDGNSVTLGDWIAQDPEAILGEIVNTRYKGQLPFLFKVLASAQPLSIQVHPNRQQAAEGFAREEAAGIPFDALHRNYRDTHHKPELIVALGPFWALQGFREASDIQHRLNELQLTSVGLQLETFLMEMDSEEAALKALFTYLMQLPEKQQKAVVTKACQNAAPLADKIFTYQWVLRLQEFYPGDIGVLSPLLFNLVQLRAGEAIYQHSGQIHAYLEGVGIEIMANSDNVLRAGLTQKHIDLEELLKIANFNPTNTSRIQQRRISPQESVYMAPAPEFVLYRGHLDGNQPFLSATQRSIEILLCIEGSGTITNTKTSNQIQLKSGTCVLIPASLRQYQIEGDLAYFRAAVPLTSG